MRAIQIAEFGGPEVLQLTQVADPGPRGAEQLMDVVVAGINYADTHQAENSYLTPQQLPLIPGSEVVVRAPDGRLALAFVSSGGYAERIAVDPALMYEIPSGVSNAAALAGFVNGVTAWYMLNRQAVVQPGESVLVHAGAGGVGTMAIQLAKQAGAGPVIATASSESKRALANRLGADEVLDSRTLIDAADIRASNGGQKVDVVLEMVGGRTFDESLAALATFGRMITFGQAGRLPARPIDPTVLMARTQIVGGFSLVHLLRRPEVFRTAVAAVLELIAAGCVEPVVGKTYALNCADDAHRALRDRTSIGKLIIDLSL